MLRSTVLVLAVSIPAPALAQNGPFFPVDTHRIGSDILYSMAALGRCELASLTSDKRPDAVYMGGDRLLVSCGAAIYDSVQQLEYQGTPSSGTDLAILKGGGPPGLDSVLLSGLNGLEEWEVNESGNGSYDKQSVASSSGFASLVRLHTGNIGGQPQMDVVGLASSANRLIVKYDSLSATPGQIQFGAGVVIYDFALLRWDSDDILEIAALTSAGIQIRNNNATLLYQAAYGAFGDALVPIRYANGPDRLLLSHGNPNGSSTIYVLLQKPAPDLGVVQDCGTRPDFVAVGGTSSDIDLDAKPEAVLSAGAIDDLLVLPNQGTSSPDYDTFDAASFYPVDPGGQPSQTTTGWPAAGDVDNDGDPDLVYPVSQDPDDGPFVAMMPSRQVDARVKKVSITGGTVASAPQSSIDVDLDLDPPGTHLAITGGNQMKLQVTRWIHDEGFVGDPPTIVPDDPDAVQVLWLDVSPGWGDRDLDLDGLDDDPDEIIHSMVIREVECLPGSAPYTIVSVGPDYVACMGRGTNSVQGPLTWLMDQFGMSGTLIELGGGGQLGISVLPLSRVPAFTDNLFIKDN